MNNKKNWIWIIENFNFSKYEDVNCVFNELDKITQKNSINMSTKEKAYLASLIYGQAQYLKMIGEK